MIEIRKAVETEKNDRKNINTDNAAHISWYLYLAKPYRTGTCGLSDTFTGPPGHCIDHTIYNLYTGNNLIGFL